MKKKGKITHINTQRETHVITLLCYCGDGDRADGVISPAFNLLTQ